MQDDNHDENYNYNENDDAQTSDSDLPASVIFMEMMRLAAAKAAQVQSEQLAAKPAPEKPAEPPAPIETPPSQPVEQAAEPPRRERTRRSRPTEASAPAPEPEVTPVEPVVEAVAEVAAPEAEIAEPEVAAPETVEAEQPTKPPEPASEPLPTQPLTAEERRQAAALEAQRLHRVKRRQEKRRAHRVSILGGIIRSFLVIIPSALLMATILSWWTDPQFLKREVRAGLAAAISASGITPSPTVFVPTPNWLRKIGIVSGHNGPRPDGSAVDPGAVCEDALGNVLFTEREINFNVATLVVRGLRDRGYSVDLLDEFDPRLQNYQAAALVSIHANTCQDFGEEVSGYLVAKADSRPEGGIDTLLAECVARYYGDRSKLDRRFGLTLDMTDYHSFREIHPTTPAAIIELGFMRADQQILTENPEILARGIIDGILCFVDPQFDIENAPPTALPTASATP